MTMKNCVAENEKKISTVYTAFKCPYGTKIIFNISR